MGIQHEEIAPDSFNDAFKPNYLGNPEAVAALIASFCTSVEKLVGDVMYGRITPEVFTESLKVQIRLQADIFSGRDPEYITVKGYNEHNLGFKLMADLDHWWQANRAKWNDDPFCVLFEWLAVMVAEKVKLADGDEMLLEVMLKPSVQWAVHELLGNEARR
jgi:hypothetical protein